MTVPSPIPTFVSVLDFGAVADGVTDDSGAFEDALDNADNIYVPPGSYAVKAPVVVGTAQRLYGGGIGATQLIAVPGDDPADWEGRAVVELAGTRAAVALLEVRVSSALSGTQVNGIATTATGSYHQYVEECRARGAHIGFSAGGFEGHWVRCHAEDCDYGVHCTQDDNYVANFSSTDCTIGAYSSAGLEGTNLHLVRCDTAVQITGKHKVLIDEILIDTPLKVGFDLTTVSGALFNNVFFTKVGEGRVGTTDPVYYFNFTNVRGSYFRGGSIETQNADGTIDLTNQYILHCGDSDDDAVRSIENVFEGFMFSGSLAMSENSAQAKFAARQRWHGGTGAMARFNNEGLNHRAPTQIALASAAASSEKVFVLGGPKTVSTSYAGQLQGTMVARSGAANRAFGRIVVPIAASADTGSKDGVVIWDQVVGSWTPSVTVTGIAYDPNVRTLAYTLTNTSGAAVTLGYTLGLLDDNQTV